MLRIAILILTFLGYAMLLRAQTDSLVPPRVAGVIRSKFEHNFERDSGRYEIRNARVQFTGPVGRFFEYKLELDMLDEDKITYHDMFIRLNPIKGLALTIGQMKTPYSRDYLRGPSTQFFSNRSFASKQMSSNMRDVGLKVDYSQKGEMPFIVTWGMFDGSGTSNPDYVKEYKYFVGANIGPWKNLEVTGTAQSGNFLFAPLQAYYPMRMFSAGARWKKGNWLIESEYMEKTILDSIDKSFNAFLFQLVYDFELNGKAIRQIVPAIRFDFYNPDMEKTDMNPGRLTLGLTFGFARYQFADIRINYEEYFYSPEKDLSSIPEVKDQLPYMNDKITVEFTARF